VYFAAIILCVASQRVFIVVAYFVIDSFRKLSDTHSNFQGIACRSCAYIYHTHVKFAHVTCLREGRHQHGVQTKYFRFCGDSRHNTSQPLL